MNPEEEWARWKPELAKAMDGGFHTIDGVEQDIREGRSQLWLHPDYCTVTEIVDYPAERALQCLWAAGDLDTIIADFGPRIEAWARSQGCASILLESRAGWARALKAIGYEPWSVTVRKAL